MEIMQENIQVTTSELGSYHYLYFHGVYSGIPGIILFNIFFVLLFPARKRKNSYRRDLLHAAEDENV